MEKKTREKNQQKFQLLSFAKRNENTDHDFVSIIFTHCDLMMLDEEIIWFFLFCFFIIKMYMKITYFYNDNNFFRGSVS